LGPAPNRAKQGLTAMSQTDTHAYLDTDTDTLKKQRMAFTFA